MGIFSSPKPPKPTPPPAPVRQAGEASQQAQRRQRQAAASRYGVEDTILSRNKPNLAGMGTKTLLG